jgi:hypothetical protein
MAEDPIKNHLHVPAKGKTRQNQQRQEKNQTVEREKQVLLLVLLFKDGKMGSALEDQGGKPSIDRMVGGMWIYGTCQSVINFFKTKFGIKNDFTNFI